MGTWGLLQVVFDIFAALGFFIIVMRLSRAPKDDPRLSRGLQLLQSKIAVIEDLSDRTEVQVNQLATLLEQKAKEVQAKIQLADSSVQAIKVSMQNSLEVAKIFQDKIPHQEIIERQNSIKYVQAARLAHQGLGIDEIAAKVDLPKGEIEFICKVNREQLMFNEENLPEWAKDAGSDRTLVENDETTSTNQLRTQDEMQASTLEPQSTEPSSLNTASPIPGGPLSHMDFAEGQADQSARLRAEIELAERQRLVEHLSRLQFEMQNLDMQLARETSNRPLTAAFEAPRINGDALQKLGEEFRKACETANEQRSFLPPLEQLSTILPQIFPPSEIAPSQPPAAMPVAGTPPSVQSLSATPAAQPLQRQEPVIRKVVFPRIDATEL